MHLQLTAGAAAIIALITGVVYLAERLTTLLWAAGALFALGSAVVTVFWFKEEDHSSGWLRFWIAYASYVAALVAAFAVAAAGIGLLELANGVVAFFELARSWMQTSLTAKTLTIGGTAVVTALLGGAFFYFRLRQRFLYGTSEALAGIMIAAHRVSIEPGAGLPNQTGFYLAVLTAGVYLVVRGLDNMHQGIQTKEQFPGWLSHLFERWNRDTRASAARANPDALTKEK